MVLTTLVLGAAFTTSHWWVWLIVGLVAGFLATRFVKIPFPHFGIIGIIVVWPRRRISCRAGDKPLASQYHAWLLCHDSCRFPGGCRPPGNHALWRRARRTFENEFVGTTQVVIKELANRKGEDFNG